MKMTSFSINGRAVSRLSINGREVSLRQEPVLCDALCFTAEEPGSTVGLHKRGFLGIDLNLQTSSDGINWAPYTLGNTIYFLNVGDKVYFKAVGSNSVVSVGPIQWAGFIMTGKIAASGNINSLLEEDEDTARTMSLVGKDYYCYYNLFNDCTSLTQAPELPAIGLSWYCYRGMFSGCTSLTQAPALPATTLGVECYRDMFNGCTALTQAPELPAINVVLNCYQDMFNGCTSLTQAPELPATLLNNECYKQMFYGCSSLNSIKVAFTHWSPANATTDWLPDNVGTFECPWDLITNTSTRDTSTVPANWSMVAV